MGRISAYKILSFVVGAAIFAGSDGARAQSHGAAAVSTTVNGPNLTQYSPSPQVPQKLVDTIERLCTNDKDPAATLKCWRDNMGPYMQGGNAQICPSILSQLQQTAGSLNRYCAEASSSMQRSSLSQSPTASRASASQIRACMTKLHDCAVQEDELDDSIEGSESGTLLSELNTNTSCNETANAEAEDVKRDIEDFERQLDANKKDQVELQHKISEAQKKDADDALQLLNDYQTGMRQRGEQRDKINADWAAKIAGNNKAQSEEILNKSKGYSQFLQQQQQAANAYAQAIAGNRNAIRVARAACEDRARKLMAELEKQRLADKKAFLNNTGNVNALTGSVAKFQSRYAQDLNQCLATDYRRSVDASNDALAIAKNLFDQAQSDASNARKSLDAALAASKGARDEQMTNDQQQLQAQLARLDQADAQETASYSGKTQAMARATAQRKQSELQEESNMAQQYNRILGKYQTALNRQRQLPVASASKTRSAARRRTTAEQGLEKMGNYTFLYCTAKSSCQDQMNITGLVDPGTCGAAPRANVGDQQQQPLVGGTAPTNGGAGSGPVRSPADFNNNGNRPGTQ